VNIAEGHFPLRCFAKDCRVLLTEEDIRKAELEEMDLHKWRRQTLFHLPGMIPCPRNCCDAVLQHDGGKKEVLCGKCFKVFCPTCLYSAHNGVPCKDIRKIEGSIRGEIGLKQLEQADIVQRCPNCQAPTIRIDKCPHMFCSRCQTGWKYRGEYRIITDKTLT
jgi:endogenous inhibitor of DNA gyrase (YacG/DUF329 family)